MRVAIVLGAFASLFGTPLAQAQTPPVPVISVTGEASISVAPDLAEIEGGVSSEARTAREASEANNKAMGLVLLAIKSAGVPDADVQTARLSLSPQTTPTRPNGPSQITGYRAGNRVTIRLRDVTKVAGIIDTLVGAGANEISGIGFSVAQPSALLDEARVKAMADAQRKAEIYARAAGVTLGSPLSIAEDGGPVPFQTRKFAAGVAAAPVAPGEETLRITVSVSYAIKPTGQ